ncbi:MAG: (d)CMP kinase [Chloroflexota bacterium]
MSRPTRIAVDGPVASGKSTLGRGLAQAFDALYLDTGVMYRGLTALALERNIDVRDEAAITALAQAVRFSFPQLAQAAAVNPTLLADGIDITDRLRSPAVDRNVSAVSSYASARAAMVVRQRAIARERFVVMVGRDIGTVVLPDAEAKLFVTADVEERARRRNAERRAAGIAETPEETLADLRRRDLLDSERPVAPLRRAEDAILLDTTALSGEQAFDRAIALVRDRLKERTA